MREESIPISVSQGLGDIGITRMSYLEEFIGSRMEPGTQKKGIALIETYDKCPQYLIPIARTRPTTPLGNPRIPVQKGIEKTIYRVMLASPGSKNTDRDTFPCYSVPGALDALVGQYGICRVSPLKEKDFRGDIGEDGYPYERLEKKGFGCFSKIETLERDERDLPVMRDPPVLIANMRVKERINEYIRQIGTGMRRLGNIAKTYDWEKIEGKYKSTLVSTRSQDREIQEKIWRDVKENVLVINPETGTSRLFTPKTLRAVFYGTERQEIDIGIENYKPNTRRVSSAKALKREISEAVRQGYQHLAIIGEREKSRGCVSLKDLEARSQKIVPVERVARALLEEKNTRNSPKVLVQEEGTPLSERRLARPGREYCTLNNLEWIETSYKDIPALILEGVEKRGVTGYDILVDYLCSVNLLETPVPIERFNETASKKGIPLEVLPLGTLECKICLAEPENPEEIKEKYGIPPEKTRSLIVTPYEGIATRLWPEKTIVKTIGTTEVFPYMVLDVVSTGETLRRNNKRIVSTILDSEAVLVYRKRVE